MAQGRYNRRGRAAPALAVAVASWVVLQRNGQPIVDGVEINVIPALAACLLALSGFALIADIFRFLAEFFDWVKAKTPTGRKGTAGWVKSLRQIRKDIIKHGWGPYWGTFKGKEVIADFESSAYAIGPSGVGKSTKFIQTNALALKDWDKTIFDFKSDLTPVLINILSKYGDVKVLNLGGLYRDIVGEGDEYNPLCVIADNFWKNDDGLLNITDILDELCKRLYPESKGGGAKDDNKYFRDGTRMLLAFAIQTCILIDGYDATLGDVLQILNDREAFLKHALWACGKFIQESEAGKPEVLPPMPLHDSPWAERHDREDVDNYIAYYRGIAAGVSNLLDMEESRAAEAFLTGAQQSLARFNITTRAHRKTKRTTFRFSEQKEGDKPTTIFIMLDPNKIGAQAPVLDLIQWCMGIEIRQHPNKHRPVYLLADEASNLPWSGLGSLLTWCRSYSLRLLLVFQNFPAFAEVHGESTLEILQSECEIKLFLAGQRNQKTLKAIEEILSQQSIIAKNHSGKHDSGFGVDGFNYQEEARPVMTADEIRRSKKAILIIRDNKPMQVDLPSIAAIAPWRTQIDINPFYGKPFLKRIKLRLRNRDGWFLILLIKNLFRPKGDRS